MISADDLKKSMERVNDYWIGQNPRPGDCAWERAAYFLGNMAAYEVLKKPGYLEYAVEWANANHWNFHDNEGECTTNADNLSCGETYLDLMEKYAVPGKMEHIRATMEWTARDPRNDYWWWVDTMYMALNFYHRMGLLLEDERLMDKAYRLYRNAKEERRLYDPGEGLWYRDENFLPEIARTAGGKKVFWARGNGWVFAGLARTLRTLPAECRYYEEYAGVYRRMARALEGCQCEDGFWHTSLTEPEEFDMPETSGTVLIVLGMLIGIRQGLIPESYMECALRGFDALNREAVEESGRIGWVQAVALKPGPVRKDLLVCKELIDFSLSTEGQDIA